MSTHPITFDDGAGYERYMGVWSQLAGEAFLGWLSPGPNLRWLDVGCGSGAFTEILARRCSPASLTGIDPSAAQLEFARARPSLRDARFRQADAQSLPFPDGTFDAAVMPLVIFFVPNPSAGVAEMARVVRPGGTVCAYAWDLRGGGFPYDLLWSELAAMNIERPREPSPDASNLDVLEKLWNTADLRAVQTTALTVHRTFRDFDDYWTTFLGGPSSSKQIASLSPDAVSHLQSRLRARLSIHPSGSITLPARANAVRGQVPT